MLKKWKIMNAVPKRMIKGNCISKEEKEDPGCDG
jgi:hypothetical protein